jgi:hypothetical protein
MRTGAAFVMSAALALLVALSAGACGEDQPTCFAGEYAACNCAGGARGYQVCLASQDAYAACVCDGTTPGLDAGTGTGGGLHKDAAADADGGD